MRLLRRRKRSRSSTPAWLVVGLGNPGKGYENTRHNAGARAAERLAEELDLHLKPARRAPALAGESNLDGRRLVVARSGTFMNESGRSVAALARYYDVEPDRIVVLHDDLDLAPGALRLKLGGGNAGHHGLDSVTKALGSGGFYRVRIGIGRPRSPRQEPADFVLEPMSAEAAEKLGAAETAAAAAALAIIQDGLEAARNRYRS